MAIEQPTVDAWTGIWYPQTMQVCASIAGWGNEGTDGQTMPILSSLDTMALLGLLLPAVVKAIEDFSVKYNEAPPAFAAIQSDLVNSEGVIVVVDSTAKYIDAKTYIGYSPDSEEYGFVSDTPWKRFPDPSGQDTTMSYEVYSPQNPNLRTSSAQVVIFVRQMISDWQACIRASSAAILSNAADVTKTCPDDDLYTFLSSVRKLCLDLDVLKSNPPPVISIAEALRRALEKTSEFIGKAAAEISKELGKDVGIVGGGLTEGFLANAGILSIIVIGILVHLFLK